MFLLNYTVQCTYRCATQLSANEMVVSRARSAENIKETMGTVRMLAVEKHRYSIESQLFFSKNRTEKLHR